MLKSAFSYVKIKKFEIIIIVMWFIAVSLVIINAYLSFYYENPFFDRMYSIYEGPSLDSLDIIALLIVSFFVGIIITDMKWLVLGYMFTVLLSLIFGIFISSFFIWNTLKYGEVLSILPYGWEHALYAAILVMFKMSFPMFFVACLSGAIFGVVFRVMVYT